MKSLLYILKLSVVQKLLFACIFICFLTNFYVIPPYIKILHDDSNVESAMKMFYPENRNIRIKVDFNQKGKRSIEKLGNIEEKLSPACNPRYLENKIDRIHFVHNRKAGGSSIRRYLEIVSNTLNITLTIQEGEEAEMPMLNGSTFYITNLREPMSRILSAYKYEGRWDCKKVKVNMSNVTENNSKTFEDFIKNNEEITKKMEKTLMPHYLWSCSHNCYLRWFSDIHSVQDMHTSLSVAREKLRKFDFIIITERLKDHSYTRAIEDIFGVPGFYRTNVNCGKIMKKLNDRYPPSIDSKIWDEVKVMNELDIKLYKEFTTCENGIKFPNNSKLNFISNA